jgi:hypothetical protein
MLGRVVIHQLRGGRMNLRTHRRTTAALLAASIAALLAVAAGPSARAGGVTWQDLDARGWTCFVPPAFPDQVACFNPGLGRPFPGSTRPSYSFVAFSRASGELLHTGHLIRGDLYSGQPCGDDAYRFIPQIGYWECIHP